MGHAYLCQEGWVTTCMFMELAMGFWGKGLMWTGSGCDPWLKGRAQALICWELSMGSCHLSVFLQHSPSDIFMVSPSVCGCVHPHAYVSVIPSMCLYICFLGWCVSASVSFSISVCGSVSLHAGLCLCPVCHLCVYTLMCSQTSVFGASNPALCVYVCLSRWRWSTSGSVL